LTNKKIITFSIILILIFISFILLSKIQIKFEDFKNQIKSKDLKIKKLNQRISSIEKAKNLSNKEIFPNTQFAEFKFEEFKIPFKKEGFENYTANSGKTNPFYISSYEDKIFIISKNSEIFFLDLKNNNKIKSITNNLNAKNVYDTLIFDNDIYVVVSQYDKSIKKNNNISGLSCKHYFSRKILKSKINFSNLKFEEFYNEKICWDTSGKENGGRVEIYYDKISGPNMLLSVYDYIKDEKNVLKLNDGATKYISINMKTKEVKDYAYGFRNPQGLLVLNKNVIISSEHGPRGGDEINRIYYNNNYGWPISSYGEKYNEGYNSDEKYYYKKSHKKFNFIEPIYAFVPSIGISQIIEVKKEFLDKWKNNILISSLRNRSLYRVVFDDNYERLISMERIHIGKRIRDISYNEYQNAFLLALENSPATLGIIKVKNKD